VSMFVQLVALLQW